jgi:hypothetical protein
VAVNRGRHLADDHLVALYFSAADEADAEERDILRRHVAECEACAERYGRLAESLAAIEASGVAEADAVFTAGRLEHQRAHILRRLETSAHPARVVLFPSPVPRGSLTRAPRRMTRWIAAAAVAGLVVGMTVGRLVEIGGPAGGRSQGTGRTIEALVGLERRDASPGSGFASSADPTGVTQASDEALLSELDEAIYQPRIAELQALAALTPLVGEASYRLR